jgi:hypothetical protein
MPIYRSKPQAPIIHFLPQSVSILLYGLSHKAMSPTGPHVGINLQPNVLVKYQETIVFCVFKIHRNAPHIKERGSLITLLAYVYGWHGLMLNRRDRHQFNLRHIMMAYRISFSILPSDGDFTPRRCDNRTKIGCRGSPANAFAGCFRLDPHNDPNEAYEVVQTPGLVTRPANGLVDGAVHGFPGQALPAASEGSCYSVRHRPGVPRSLLRRSLGSAA